MYVQDECSFVSLRDVDRALSVMLWFYGQRDELFEKMNERGYREYRERTPQGRGEEEEEDVGSDEEDPEYVEEQLYDVSQ